MGKPTGPNNGFLCFTYAIMTIVATTMSMAIVVAVGLTGAGNVLATMLDGYCDKFFHRSAPLLLSMFGIILQVIAFITAIILYLLVTRTCCEQVDVVLLLKTSSSIKTNHPYIYSKYCVLQ